MAGLALRIGLAAAAAQMCRRPVVAVVVGRLPESAAALVVRRPFWLFTHVYLFTHFIKQNGEFSLLKVSSRLFKAIKVFSNHN